MRRMAELCELLDQEDMARLLWERAAQMGDEDAQNYLEVLEEEDTEQPTAKNTDSPSREASLPDPVDEWCRIRRAEKWDYPPIQAIKIRIMSGHSERAQAIRNVALEAVTHQMVGKIEQYIANPDHITDGGRL
ncbi:hypothetical protein ACH4RA_18580 [Streptomyces smyrnaeus]|uniref:hypothetical protein n=1 Tax=Streptomyces smyrnaeus TaxID=1387713 RepID=UPI0037B91BF0